MTLRTLAVLLCAALIVPAFADSADAARKKRKHVKPIAAPHQTFGVPKTYRNEPARMIEIAPGRWISTYGCFTDEGYGRYGSCDMREGPM
jgi:hypothetical protein